MHFALNKNKKTGKCQTLAGKAFAKTKSNYIPACLRKRANKPKAVKLDPSSTSVMPESGIDAGVLSLEPGLPMVESVAWKATISEPVAVRTTVSVKPP